MTDSDNSSPFDDITERNPSSNALETTEVRLQMLTLDVDNVSNQQGFEAAENGLVVPENDGIPETRSEERLLSGSPMISAPSEIGKEIRELSSASVAFVDISSTPETTEEPLQMLTLEASNDVAGVEETPNQQGLGAENGLDVAEHDGRPKPLIEEPIASSPPMISTASETGEEVRELHSIGVASRDNTSTRETTLERLQMLTSDQWNGVAGVDETSNRQDLGGVESGLVVPEHDERPKPEVLETFATCPPMISTASETGEEAREFYSVGVALRESANTLETTEERLQMLTLEESNGDAGVQETSDQQGLGEAENGLVVPEHDGRPEPEIEVAIESSRPMISAAYETAEEVRVLSSAGIAARDSSEVEADQPLSPSSSGYAGERGSSSSTSASEIKELDGDEIDEMTLEDGPGDASSDSVPWLPGKRHVDEDDASISWRKRKKHFLVLSHSGKPIYSRYGDEYKLAGFSATLQAIISFVENGGDHVKFVRAGKHQVVFLVKGPIYLVCISCTEEPYEALRGQLDLIYGQMILILTKSVNRCFEKNPKFDMTPLLGGTEAVFSSLIHSFSWNPATFLHAYTCLPLPYPTRQAAGAILQDVAESGVLFAILMCKHKVVSLVGAQKASLHPDDMLLLSNFILSSESFRTSESFSPICLPRYNPMAFLYAYVRYLDVDTYLVLLTTSSDAFYHLKDCRIRIEMVLLKSNVLSEVQRSMLDGGLRVEYLPLDPSPRSGSLSPHLGQDRLSLTESPERFKEVYVGIGGPAGLWHFIYRSIYLDQYVSSEFSPPIISTIQQKRLYRAYQKLYASMHHRGIGPHKTQFRRDENYVLLCWMTQDFELYAAFDPLADKALAINTCNRVCQWVRDVENEIFLQGASPFSW